MFEGATQRACRYQGFRRCSCKITAVGGYGTPLTLTSSHKSRKVTKFRDLVVTAATLCRRQS
jgi:hypothetical protein